MPTPLFSLPGLAEAIAKALEKVEGENLTRQGILEGKLLQQVYEEYGIL